MPGDQAVSDQDPPSIDTANLRHLRHLLGRAPLRPEWRTELERAAVNALPVLLDEIARLKEHTAEGKIEINEALKLIEILRDERDEYRECSVFWEKAYDKELDLRCRIETGL